jgi:hypothetical protein
MIEIIKGLPDNVCGFIAIGKISGKDYDLVVYPEVKRIAHQSKKINYLLIIETSLEKYTSGAWIKDALLGLKYFTRWNKIAIVSEHNSIKKFTNFFGNFIPGQAKGFLSSEVTSAKNWVRS